jgi:hypothetical protein
MNIENTKQHSTMVNVNFVFEIILSFFIFFICSCDKNISSEFDQAKDTSTVDEKNDTISDTDQYDLYILYLNEYAVKFCHFIENCYGYNFFFFQDLDTCIQEQSTAMFSLIEFQNSKLQFQSKQAEKCLNQLNQAYCENRKTLRFCDINPSGFSEVLQGPLQENEPCYFHSQCRDKHCYQPSSGTGAGDAICPGYCKKIENSDPCVDGICESSQNLGDPCTADAHCKNNMVCDFTDYTSIGYICKDILYANDACGTDSLNICGNGLICLNNTCQKNYATEIKEGENCTDDQSFDDQNFFCEDNFYCDKETLACKIAPYELERCGKSVRTEDVCKSDTRCQNKICQKRCNAFCGRFERCQKL